MPPRVHPCGEVRAGDTGRGCARRGAGRLQRPRCLPGQANVGGNGEFAATPPQSRPSFPVKLTVTSAEGAVLATRTVIREWMTPGESARVLTINADKVAGVLFTPPPGTPKHPGVVLYCRLSNLWPLFPVVPVGLHNV